MAQPGNRHSSRASYNDVFFQRRAGEDDSATAGRPQQRVDAQAAPEISEISEIPEIREVAALPEAQTDQAFSAVTEAERAPEEAQVVEVRPALAAVAIMSAEAAADPTARVDALPAEKEARADEAPVASRAPDHGEDQPEAQNGGGLLKRLFGRFGR